MAERKDPPRHPVRREPRSVTRRRIMTAALDAFEEQGFVRTSIEDIVTRAGYTRGAFYSTFPDKEAVLFALMDERLEAEAQQLAAIFDSSSPATILDDLRRWTERPRDTTGVGRIEFVAEFRAYSSRRDVGEPRVTRPTRRARPSWTR